MQERGYQPNFFASSEAVRDPKLRQTKADKISWVLTQLAPFDLSTAICLDVGCSSGIMTTALAPLFKQTYGLDFDALALANIAPERRTNVSYIRGDAMCIPLPDNSVNVVICAQVYEHVPNDNCLFSEIYRVLAPGGIVYFSGPNWLFPIEPHYSLPFLHWLPPKYAGQYLQLTRLDNLYYERSRTSWELRRLMQDFEIFDLGRTLMQTDLVVKSTRLRKVLLSLPTLLWLVISPLLPNFNWLLVKPDSAQRHQPLLR